MHDPEKRDAFNMYRGGGDGNAGRDENSGFSDPWDVASQDDGFYGYPEDDRGYSSYDEAVRDNDYVFRFGLAGLICSFVPVPLVGILGFIFSVMATTKAKQLFLAGYLLGNGRAGRIMARIGWVVFFFEMALAICCAAFLVWVFRTAIAGM